MKTVLYFRKVQLGDYKALYKRDWVAGSIMSHLAGYGLEEHENCTTGAFPSQTNLECLGSAVNKVQLTYLTHR